MLKPKVEVLLVTYNHEEFVLEALDSIAAQVVPEYDLRILVADDVSTDGTLNVVSEWGQSHPELELKILPSSDRLGITMNYARAIASSSADFIAVLEGDDFWLRPDKLSQQLSVFENRPDVSMVSCRFMAHGASDVSAFVAPVIGTESFVSFLDSDSLARDNFIGTFSCCVYRGSLLRAVPAEIFETVAYDWAINMYLSTLGNVGFVPIVGTYYRQHSAGTWSTSNDRQKADALTALIPVYRRVLPQVLHPGLQDSLRRTRVATATIVDGVAGPHNLSNHLRVPKSSEAIPKVTVVLTSFNRAKFIQDAIDSVLEQSFQDWEIVVIDDASTDNSWSQISKSEDSRIRSFRLASNVGGAAALNIGIQESRGEYIAVLNCDDTWEPDKLSRQVEVLESSKECQAVFTEARFIDSQGANIPWKKVPPWFKTVFQQPNRPRLEWIHDLVVFGNVLCHPSALVRRDAYLNSGLYDNRFRQLPDFKKWLELSELGEFHILSGYEGVNFRILENNQNASSVVTENMIRGRREHQQVLEEFIENMSLEDFLGAFHKYFLQASSSSFEELQMEKALVWLEIPGPLRSILREIGVKRLASLMESPSATWRLRATHNVGVNNLFELQAEARDFIVNQGIAFDASEVPTRELYMALRARLRAMRPSRIFRHAIVELARRPKKRD